MQRLPAIPMMALALALSTGGCSFMKATPSSNVRPPAPGVPADGQDVTGIYRSIHQGLLQFRADGDFVLVVPDGPGPSSGTFTLRDGRMEVRSAPCGEATGSYEVVVTGEQEAGKAVLNLSPLTDACDDRRHYLTVDPWVYADS